MDEHLRSNVGFDFSTKGAKILADQREARIKRKEEDRHHVPIYGVQERGGHSYAVKLAEPAKDTTIKEQVPLPPGAVRIGDKIRLGPGYWTDLQGHRLPNYTITNIPDMWGTKGYKWRRVDGTLVLNPSSDRIRGESDAWRVTEMRRNHWDPWDPDWNYYLNPNYPFALPPQFEDDTVQAVVSAAVFVVIALVAFFLPFLPSALVLNSSKSGALTVLVAFSSYFLEIVCILKIWGRMSRNKPSPWDRIVIADQPPSRPKRSSDSH